MKHTRTVLTAVFGLFLVIEAVIAVLFETDILPCGQLATEDKRTEFVWATVMELLTIAVIPLALRLFRFGRVARSLTSAAALLRWAMLRLLMLCVPMVVNLLLYYLFMNVAFGYMSIILVLCLFFVVPTKSRCEAELGLNESSEH